jgi:hypothetical protein
MDITLHDIQQQVQENAAFSLLTWLLETGALNYTDYEQWRYGAVDHLQDCVAISSEQWISLLAKVERLATGLGLCAEQQTYFDWRSGHADDALRIASDARIARGLALRWQRPRDLMQLDLFMDNGAVLAEQALLDALAARDVARAEQAYARLIERAPMHESLSGFESLLAYAAHISAQPQIVAAPGDPTPLTSLNDEYVALVDEIAPLARTVLRQQARDFLAQAWRRLALAMQPVAFDSARPDFHASYVWGQVPDWGAVVASITSACATSSHLPPQLLPRWAVALQHLQQPEQALWLWCVVFECAEQIAQAQLGKTGSPRLQALWRRFCDLDPDLSDQLFPAWLLLNEPGLLRCGAAEARLPEPTSASWQAAKALAQARLDGADPVAARKQLQAIAPDLLSWYLR